MKLRPKLLKTTIIQATLKSLQIQNIMVSFQRDFHIWMNDYENLNENDSLVTWTKWNPKPIAKIETMQQIVDKCQVNSNQSNTSTMLNSNWTMHNPTPSEPCPQKETWPQINNWNERAIRWWWCDKNFNYRIKTWAKLGCDSCSYLNIFN